MRRKPKSKKAIFLLAVSIIALVSGYFNFAQISSFIFRDNTSRITRERNYVGSLYEGNYIWGGAMNLAWNELAETIIKEPVQLNSQDEKVLSLVAKFNAPAVTTDDLDNKSYYVKSGYGQATVDTINKESKRKFPSKSFGDLNLHLGPQNIISYAYFLKEVEYPVAFEETTVKFLDLTYKGFSIDGEKSRTNVEIVKYWNDDKFIISLRLKNRGDQLIVAKGFEMNDPTAVANEIVQNSQESFASLGEYDVFAMPNLHLEYRRHYNELLNIPFANANFSGYSISEMYENIAFDMDYKGARVENEAVIDVLDTFVMVKNNKLLIMDKPFWVVMKRTNSNNPYFILGVVNDKIMEKVVTQGM